MRVLLIRHKTTWTYPVIGRGVGIAATALARAGHAVEVLDNNSFYRFYSDAELLDRARRARPDLIGLSISLHNAAASYALAARLRRALPDAWLLAGGIHMRHCAEEALRRGFDVVVEREAERVVAPLAACLERAGRDAWRQEIARVPGVSYLSDGGEPRRATSHPQVAHLDEVPRIDYGLFNLGDFLRHGREPGAIRVGGQRGCPFSCAFCSDAVQRRDRRSASADRLFEEVRALHRAYGIPYFVIEHNNFTLPRATALAFCHRVQRSRLRGRLSFAGYTNLRAPLDDELLAAMRVAGFVKIGLGVERMDTAALRAVDKRHTPQDVREALARLRRNRIGASVAILLGFPFERVERLRREREAFRGLLPWTHRFDVSVLSPTPGTTFYDDHPELHGWYLAPPWLGAGGAYYAHAVDDLDRLALRRDLYRLGARVQEELLAFMLEFRGHSERSYLRRKSLGFHLAHRGDRAFAALSRGLARRSPALEETLLGPLRAARHYVGSWRYGGQIEDFR